MIKSAAVTVYGRNAGRVCLNGQPVDWLVAGIYPDAVSITLAYDLFLL